MDRLFRIRIDLAHLRSHLSREDNRDVSPGEVHQFLLDSGFKPDGEWWIVKEKALGALDPSEVKEATVLGEESADD